MLHLDQHALTALTQKKGKAFEAAVGELRLTGRAQPRALSDDLDLTRNARQLFARSTVLACEHAVVPIGPHRGSAVGTVGHDILIGDHVPNLKMQSWKLGVGNPPAPPWETGRLWTAV